MSKSDPHPGACLFLSDPPHVVGEKIGKAITDNENSLTFDFDTRPGISNLIYIYSKLTSHTTDSICSQFYGARELKDALVDVLNRHLLPIQENYSRLNKQPRSVEEVLRKGNASAKVLASNTMEEVETLVGMRR